MINIENLKKGTRIKVKSLEEIEVINNNFIDVDRVIENFLRFCAGKVLTVREFNSDEIYDEIYIEERKDSCLLIEEIENIREKSIIIKIDDKHFKL